MRKIKKLSVGQKKVAAEIFGNIAVAWFATGIIAPLLGIKADLIFFWSNFVLSLSMTMLFSAFSLHIVRRIRT